MFNLKSQYPIGIDIGNHNIYAVQLQENKQGLVVRELVHREFEGGNGGILDLNDIVTPLLRKMVKNNGFKGKRIVVQFPSQYMVSFPINFEVSVGEAIEEAILRQSKEYLTFPLEEAIIDYPSLEPLSSGDGNRYRASIIAVRRDHVKQYLRMLEQAGLTVEVLDFGISSLIRLHSYPHKTINNPIILCHIGWSQSQLSVVTPESILVQRNVPWGLHLLLRNLHANLELSNDKNKGRVLLREYGLFYEDCLECKIDDLEVNEKVNSDESRGMYRAIYQIINPQIEELVHEMHTIIGYARSEEHDAILEGIYIYGEGSSIRHLDRYLESRLNLQARLMNPLTKIALGDESILPDISQGAPFGLAMGLALRKISWL